MHHGAENDVKFVRRVALDKTNLSLLGFHACYRFGIRSFRSRLVCSLDGANWPGERAGPLIYKTSDEHGAVRNRWNMSSEQKKEKTFHTLQIRHGPNSFYLSRVVPGRFNFLSGFPSFYQCTGRAGVPISSLARQENRKGNFLI